MPLSTAAALDQHLREATVNPYRQVPRAVFLAATSDDPALYRGHAGWARLPAQEVGAEELAKQGTPIEEDSRFELFSCTKLCGSIAALQLVEQGKVDLHGEARQYVPEIADLKVLKGFGDDGEPVFEQQDRSVTVQQLLTHTSGSVRFSLRPSCSSSSAHACSRASQSLQVHLQHLARAGTAAREAPRARRGSLRQGRDSGASLPAPPPL